MNPIGLFVIAIGAFVLTAVFKDWDWFLLNRRARLFVSLFGRSGARVFYAILGAVFLLGGVVLLFTPA